MSRFQEGENAHQWPQFLPEGTAVLFTGGTGGGSGDTRISVQSMDTGERHDLVVGGTYPRYASSGHLLYAQMGNLMAVPFDARRLEVMGASVAVVEGVVTDVVSGTAYAGPRRTFEPGIPEPGIPEPQDPDPRNPEPSEHPNHSNVVYAPRHAAR